jgi:hypothetical protein
MPRRDPQKAIQVLDTMLEFFDGGRRWRRGELVSNDDNSAALSAHCGTSARNMTFAVKAPFTICAP